MKAVEYMPSDYTWVISKDTEANPNTAKFDVILKVVEFDVEYDFETAKEAESSVEEIIQSLIETRVKKQKLELPIPLKFSRQFTGRLTVRLSPETHRRIYLEAMQTDQSLNQVIERKLASK